MFVIYVIIWCFSVLGAHGYSDGRIRRFPDDFLFGVSTSAYQVEGAWDLDGKSESVWDRFLHKNPDMIADGRNGDIACDSYHNYKRDVEMLRELGVDYYRFSISWPRIMPDGFSNNINKKGLEYYDKFIDELLKYNIKPMVTIYHFDLPQKLQDLGGWANPLCVHWFEDYAKVVFKAFAHKVPYWITINQPNFICVDGYGGKANAPGIGSSGIGDYMCIKNVMLAHAKAYRFYETEYKDKFNGSVGISLAMNWADPVINNTENYQATELYRDFTIGLYVNPIWSKHGDFPSTVKDRVLQRSRDQGYMQSRLPVLSPEEIKLLKGSADFMGVNHYTTFLVKTTDKVHSIPSIENDIGVEVSFRPEWKKSQSSWLRSAPYGIYKLCLYLNKEYDYPAMIVTEHGWSTKKVLKDGSRVRNMREFFKALLLAVEDGARVKGYTAWSLMDNVEWGAGTSERFGLYEVDFESKEKTRTARLSALVYKRIIERRFVEEGWKPDNLNISIIKTSRAQRNNIELYFVLIICLLKKIFPHQ
ncbi:myrosinase 1-like [Pararge aegeria]|uniref:Cytosolic beta-glucosidase n=1 Tax=Pararge aegeria aegeria TaxID=348720 RepID=A0A8S4R901_9NEOP|nr:myrosinase 1-like [Pararge aegeria]CAH2231806.1 jg3610 [Pararge aegeria aegeria]